MTDELDDELDRRLEDQHQRQLAAPDALSGQIVLEGWQPGPAGASGVTLAGGLVQLTVDHADPRLLCFLSVDEDSPAAAAALEAVVGRSFRRIGDRIEDPDDRRPVLLDPPGRGDPKRRSPPQTGPTILRLGRLAVLRSEVERVDLTDDERAVGLVELANLMAGEPASLGLTPSPRTTWAAGIEMCGPLAYARTDVRGGERRDSLRRVLLHAAANLADVDRELHGEVQSMLDRLVPTRSDLSDERSEPSVAVSRLELPASVGELPDSAAAAVPSDRADPGSPLPAPVSIEVVPPLSCAIHSVELDRGHLSVTIEPPPAGQQPWLRAFDAGAPPVPLGLSPFQPGRRGTRRALVLVPTALRPIDIVADITLQPERAWTSPVLLRVEQAVDLGKHACRAERLQDTAAWDRWQDCADKWTEVGDHRRAQTARANAQGAQDRRTSLRGPRPRMQSFAVDRFRIEP